MNLVAYWWQKIPVLVRAVVGGFLVQIIGFLLLLAIVPLNFRILPTIPWTVLPLGVALWAYWRYFGGAGWPRGAADRRRHLRRSNPVPPGLRGRVLVAGGLFSVSIVGISILQVALRELPPEALGIALEFSKLPLASSVPLALAAALFVGVSEELAFRGYMQVAIEDRHRPWLGLTVPAFAFALAHGLDPIILPVFFIVSIGWSVLARSVDSIRPGILFHFLIDAVGFLWATFRPEDLERLLATSLLDNGLTPGYRLLLIFTAAMSLTTLAALTALHRAARKTDAESATDPTP